MKEYHEEEGEGLLISHGFLLLDGSGSMKGIELRTGLPKHRAVAKMVQDLTNVLHDDPAIQDVLFTVICYDGNWVNDVRVANYDVKASEEYYKPDYTDRDLDVWDPLIGHGGTTPIGRALAFARQRAEEWVNAAPSGLKHRAAIYLLSDGMNFPSTEPNGISERDKIISFYEQQEEARKRGGEYKGRIRILTIGYYQAPAGQNPEEDEGRKLLKALAFPSEFYFETSDAKDIARFIKRTVTE